MGDEYFPNAVDSSPLKVILRWGKAKVKTEDGRRPTQQPTGERTLLSISLNSNARVDLSAEAVLAAYVLWQTA